MTSDEWVRTYFASERDADAVVRDMRRYADQPQEIDKLLLDVVAPVLTGRELTALDACCGIGHVSVLLARTHPGLMVRGVDQASFLIDEAERLNLMKSPPVQVQDSEAHDNTEKFIEEYGGAPKIPGTKPRKKAKETKAAKA